MIANEVTMAENHPITPPPELVQRWMEEFHDPQHAHWEEYEIGIATRAAQWGADQELEACIDWISVYTGLEHPELLIELLRAVRRPKPPSLNQLAMQMLSTIERDAHYLPEITDTIRRALEQLPEDK
jgi:hypothetical protein